MARTDKDQPYRVKVARGEIWQAGHWTVLGPVTNQECLVVGRKTVQRTKRMTARYRRRTQSDFARMTGEGRDWKNYRYTYAD